MTNQVHRKIFNPSGDDSIDGRQLIGGNPTGIANLNSVKYKWASPLYKIMVNNFWIPEKVSLVDDRVTIKELTPDEMIAFKTTLSFLIALDSMQTANLPKMGDYITAPEVQAIFTIQAFQELIHSQSYQYILQELFPNLEREEIYNYWRTNPLLLERNTFIANQYEEFNQVQSVENYKKSLAADFALEGIYFYSGFNYFYLLAARNKVANVAKVIKYIENDEVTHVSFMVSLIREVFDLNLESDKEILRSTLMKAAEQEIAWGHEIYGDRILGVSKKSTEAHIKYIANQRGKVVGLGVLYKGFNENPYAYLDQAKKANYFESVVTEYSQSSAVSGWDNF
jgi:ribonucleoside-diphosphate reductase beta chain